MKRLFASLICMALALVGIPNIAYADISNTNTDMSNKANVLFCSDDGIEKILNSQYEEDFSVKNSNTNEMKNTSETNISFKTETKEDSTSDITMEGYFLTTGPSAR